MFITVVFNLGVVWSFSRVAETFDNSIKSQIIKKIYQAMMYDKSKTTFLVIHILYNIHIQITLIFWNLLKIIYLYIYNISRKFNFK